MEGPDAKTETACQVLTAAWVNEPANQSNYSQSQAQQCQRGGLRYVMFMIALVAITRAIAFLVITALSLTLAEAIKPILPARLFLPVIPVEILFEV